MRYDIFHHYQWQWATVKIFTSESDDIKIGLGRKARRRWGKQLQSDFKTLGVM